MSLAPSQRTQVQTFLGGSRSPVVAGGYTPQDLADAERQRRRTAQQQQAERSRTARRESTRRAQISRGQQREQLGATAMKFAIEKLGKRQGNAYAERVRRALQRNENIPLPPAGEGREAFLKTFEEQGLSGTELRRVGFDVPRGNEVPTTREKPSARSTPVGTGVKVGGTYADAGRDDALLTGTITKDEFSRRYGFNQPSGRFEVDRVSQGNNVQDVIERKPRPQPQPEPEPEPEPEREEALIDRRRTGGASGGLPTQRSAPTGGRTTQEILAEQRSNFIAGAGLQRGRSVDTAEASGELSAGAKLLLQRREQNLARQLSSEPLGREQTANPIAGSQ